MQTLPVEDWVREVSLTVGQIYDLADALRIAAGVYEAQAMRRTWNPKESRKNKPDRDSATRAKRYRNLADRLAR